MEYDPRDENLYGNGTGCCGCGFGYVQNKDNYLYG